MSVEYDVRKTEQEKPRVFRFKTQESNTRVFDVVEVTGKTVYINNVNTTDLPSIIGSYDDARNLIKAIQTALEFHDPKPLIRG